MSDRQDDPALGALLKVAGRQSEGIVDRWGVSFVRWATKGFREDNVMDALSAGLRVELALPGVASRLRFDDDAPESEDVEAVLTLLDVDSARLEAQSAITRRELLSLVADQVIDVEVAVERPAWARSREVLDKSFVDRPADVVATALRRGGIAVGTHVVNFVTNADGETTDVDADAGTPNWLLARGRTVLDASAWISLADTHVRDSNNLLVALTPRTKPSIPVTLDSSVDGGLALKIWRDATADANRREALAFVFTQVTTSAHEQDRLPAANRVQEMAERYRIALSQENAAAVATAASSAYETAVDALTAARDTLDSELASSLKTAGTVIGALVGAASLIVRNTMVFPDSAIYVVVTVLVIVEGGLLLNTYQRIDDGLDVLVRRRKRITDDPLVPTADRERALEASGQMGVQARAIRTRIAAGLLTLLATGAVIYVGAAVAAIN